MNSNSKKETSSISLSTTLSSRTSCRTQSRRRHHLVAELTERVSGYQCSFQHSGPLYLIKYWQRLMWIQTPPKPRPHSKPHIEARENLASFPGSPNLFSCMLKRLGEPGNEARENPGYSKCLTLRGLWSQICDRTGWTLFKLTSLTRSSLARPLRVNLSGDKEHRGFPYTYIHTLLFVCHFVPYYIVIILY